MGITTVRGTISDRRTRASLVRLLRENVLASFATVDGHGRAHINTAYFAWSEDWNLFFYSYRGSRHSRNLERSPSLAVAVFDSHQRWGYPDRGVQLFGTGGEATGIWSKRAEAVYSKRFPDFERRRVRSARAGGLSALFPYRFRPRRATLFDEPSLGGGRFIEIAIP